jgi:hypothetical protein
LVPKFLDGDLQRKAYYVKNGVGEDDKKYQKETFFLVWKTWQ